MRYWKLLVLTIVPVLIFSTFYIHNRIEASKLPEVVMKNQDGDRKEIADLQIEGYVENNENVSNVLIRPDETIYFERMGYLKKLNLMFQPEVEQLVKEHRGFMRGKLERAELFYENADVLIYGDIEVEYKNYNPDSFTIQVDVLDKKTNQSTDFTIPVPNEETYDYVYAEQVFYHQGKLSIAAKSYSNLNDEDGRTGEQLEMFTIELASKKLVNQETLLTFDQRDNTWSSPFILINDDEELGNQQLLVGSLVEEFVEPEGTNIELDQLSIYDLETKEMKPVALPKEWKGADPVYFRGNMLYFLLHQDGKQTIGEWNVDTGKQEEEHSFDWLKEGSSLTFSNGKIYTIDNPMSDGSSSILRVMDAQSGESLYEGILEFKDSAKKKGYQLVIDQIRVP
ncbi:hypothetical protein DX933_16580 [Ornithinibacillus gellani]|uniref:hypothetical protein n=1 Tax=Ornithinibacillus gellani TaxID=2293253 RepID=UPI000F475A30|nr:hypothetical protein [Ornithinibacillus gellani]TQS70980.1 hypothetical protein DX933_16580 [Ornithinibacillus gellani]